MFENIIFSAIQNVLYFVLLIVGGYFFGKAFYAIYKGENVFAKTVFSKVVNKIFSAMAVNPKQEMSAKKYMISISIFSGLSFLLFFAILLLQSFFLLNPEGVEGMRWDLAFNTAASFITNTNWQAYSGETSLSYFSQMVCMTVQNFLSGAVGIAVLFALIRGFVKKQTITIGNFWADLVRIVLFMLPVCFFGALLLVSQGVPQTLQGSVHYYGLDGQASTLYLGPAASQIIIKQLFTNGGGFYGVNSAYPFENPTPLSNLVQCLSLLWIPAGLCFTFGFAVHEKDTKRTSLNKNQGIALLKTMSIVFVVCLVLCTSFEYMGQLKLEGVSSLGNMEGKEVRFGISNSALWAVATTSASNGSVNAMHDSFTSLGGMIPMFLMMLGEVIFGGVGCGLYGMIGFVLLTVFISGLMVGRTPEYLGKKIGSFDMKMVCLILLTPVLCLLIGTAATVLLYEAPSWLTNEGAHGFSEILYAFASLANNNGSASAGFNANTEWTNIVGGVVMLIVRFVPMFATLLLANNIAKKKIIPQSSGTLATHNTMFIGLLITIIVMIGALSFFPALALGPLAESLG